MGMKARVDSVSKGYPIMTGFIFAVFAMATGLAGMILFGKKRKKDELTTPVCMAFLFILLIGAVTFLVKSMTSGGNQERKADYAISYTRISALVLARHLAKTAPGSKVLVIVDDKLDDDVHAKARMDGLKAGLGDSLSIVAVDSLAKPDTLSSMDKPMAPERRIHLRKKSMASQFDELLSKYPECNLVISFIGLPQNPGDMAIWSKPPETRPRFALLRSDIRTYQDAILATAICAAVIARPDVEPNMVKPPKDPQAAFDLQFLLVTPENAAELAEKHGIFIP
jgi:hypothetical protein